MSTDQIAGALGGAGGGAGGAAGGAGGPTEMIQDGVKMGTDFIEIEQKGTERSIGNAGWGAAIMTTVAVVAAFALGFGPVAIVAMGMAGAAAGAGGGVVVGEAQKLGDKVEYLKSKPGEVAGFAATAATGDVSGQTYSQTKGLVNGVKSVSEGEAKENGGNDLVQGSREGGVEPQGQGASLAGNLVPSAGGKAQTQAIGVGRRN